MKKLVITIIACFIFFVHEAYAVSTCPKVFWVQAYNECQTGEISFGLSICANDLAQPNVVFDHVDWNFGDGSPVVSNTNLSAVYTYSTSGTYNATAQVYFTVNGSTCSTIAKCVTSQTVPGSPILVISGGYNLWLPTNIFVDQCVTPNPSLVENFIPVTVSILNTDLWINPVGPYTVGQTVGINVDIANLEVGAALVDTIRVNNLVVSTGVYTNNGLQTSVPYTLPSVEGFYVVELTASNPKRPTCPVIKTLVLEVLPIETNSCTECFTFKTDPGKRYWISAWVKVIDSNAPQNSIPQVITYDNGTSANTANIQLAFTGSGSSITTIRPSGDIIEGWQRIAGEFKAPIGATEVNIKLMNPTDLVAYFDDIRIHPFNASMKSYVNDPETFWLTAELDDNNYATFYEYDMEGKLIRIKKETSRGIVTIKENRSSNPKTN